MKPNYCACCYGQVRYSQQACAYFHATGDPYTETIARETTTTPLHKPLKAVMPAPKDPAAGMTTLPKTLKGRAIEIVFL